AHAVGPGRRTPRSGEIPHALTLQPSSNFGDAALGGRSSSVCALRADPLFSPQVARPPRPIHLVAALLSGAGCVLAFPPADVSFVAWIALVPLFLAARGGSPRAAFWLGYLWGLVAYGGILWWMTAFGPAVWILITLLSAVFPGVATLAIA